MIRGSVAVRFAFWNTHNSTGINQYSCDLICENRIDFFAMSEYKDSISELLLLLQENGINYEQIETANTRIFIICKTKYKSLMKPCQQESHYSFVNLDDSVLIGVVHLGSKMYDPYGHNRKIVLRRMMKYAREYSSMRGIHNKVLFGDFNENPYENNILDAEIMHGLSDKTFVSKKYRKIQNDSFEMFYNPSWNLFGDQTNPPGTYFYTASQSIEPVWNIFDQVIISSELIDSFPNEEFCIITSINGKPLFDVKGRPNINISDHFPIVFEIKELI